MTRRHTHKRVRIDQITPDPDNVRSRFGLTEDDSALRQSIRESGVMSDLIVCEAGRDRYLIIDGERRHRIARDLGHRELDCVVLPAMDAAERERLRFELYLTFKPLTQTEQARQRRRLRELGVTPSGEAA